MKVLVAVDKFKDALEARAVAAAIARGVQGIYPSAKLMQLPLSDGGDGFARLASRYAGAKLMAVEVSGPLQQPHTAHYAWLPRYKRAYIEMAEAAGLHLLTPSLRSPLHTTTFGVGQLIRHALELGAREIYLGIGGSATHDVGAGMAAALGYHFLDRDGRPFLPTGGSLLQVDRIATGAVHKGLKGVKIVVACDVTTPLTGPAGAAYSFARQKGATDAQLPLLDQGASHLAALLQQQLQQEVQQLPGGGAAGGLGAGALAFLGASLQPGARMVLALADFGKALADADLVITGEGSCDHQSLQGKIVGEIAAQCLKARIPLALLCGQLQLDVRSLYKAGIWYARPLSPPGEALAKSLTHTAARLEAAAAECALFFKAQQKKPR
ncbi:glycerate kinase family protein [Cesiribacter andamanensis]|uniref:Glycerate kinase n=1 Tax=Cesiribacter andamanensis AMV16 TaxID=1279009 RepID=M7N6E7_9BACT|nr:glycerate kinase [Cesiribacter andamanensis]EMR02786.1 Glycerate kinase [Cesiribacter andamanensis AMV16]